MTDERDRPERLRELFRAQPALVPAGRVSRLIKTGRAALGMAWSTLRPKRLDDDASDVDAADLEAIASLVSRLGELKGIAMKVGQIVGYADPSLAPELQRMLAVLQTASPATPFADVERTIRASLGTAGETLLARMEREPIATASIGQVHRARLDDGRVVAVKVRHPGIIEAMRADLGTAAIGPFVARIAGGASAESVRSFVREAESAFLAECDFRAEADHQRRFARIFANDDTIGVPPVLDEYSAVDVLVTEWRAGASLDAWLARGPSRAERDRIGTALFRFYLATLYRHGVFHADPHPGNYALANDGRIVVYDFGCVRTFDRETVRAFARLVAAVRDDQRDGIAAALVGLGGVAPDDDRAWKITRRVLRDFFGPLLLPGERPIEIAASRREVSSLMRDKRAVAKLALPGRLLFLFRLRFGLYSVLARVGAVADWSGVESRWAEESASRS